MSSGVDGEGLIAAALILPAAAAFGAGWLAWQGGRLLVEANQAADRQIAEKRRQLEEAAKHRRMAALSAHNQLVDMCRQVSTQLDTMDGIDEAQLRQLQTQLQQIIREPVPEDANQLETLTLAGYLKMDSVVRRQQQIAAFALEDSRNGLFSGLSVAQLMEDLRVTMEAMELRPTQASDVVAADPVVLERRKLNEQFAAVTAQIVDALEFTARLTADYGLTTAGSAWLHSCFNGTDLLIEQLCRPTTSNQELKKGIRRLEEAVERYQMMAPGIEKESRKLVALYDVYKDACHALGEKVESIKSFGSAAALEEKLKYLQTRAEEAQRCAQIYQKLGAEAYLCYAWDQELKALGYEVHSRKAITELANHKPERAQLGQNKLPFYQWNEEDLTQLYAITDECALQVIVHEDGTVSMQTIAQSDTPETVEAQRSHCRQLKLLHERLRKNWFILYDYEETGSAEEVTTVAHWRAGADNPWKSDTLITDQRTATDTAPKVQHLP